MLLPQDRARSGWEGQEATESTAAVPRDPPGNCHQPDTGSLRAGDGEEQAEVGTQPSIPPRGDLHDKGALSLKLRTIAFPSLFPFNFLSSFLSASNSF